MTQVHREKTAEQILSDLRSDKRTEITTLLHKYTLGYDDLENCLKQIESWGYSISKNDSLLLFLSAPDALIDSEISFGLQTKTIGKHILAFQSVQSTNETATKLAEQGAEEGTLVVSEKQTKGKGRFSRNWHSIEKKGIYCSIVLRPSFSPEFAPGLSLMTAVALADTFMEFTQSKVQIKWPNDLLLSGKKTAGILTELSADKKRVNHVIVGVGININHSQDDFPSEIASTATSLCIENQSRVNRILLLQKFLFNFENAYEMYKTERLASMHTKMISYSSLLNKKIQLSYGNELLGGKVVNINKDGALVLDCNGTIKTINSGEVTVVKK